PDAARAQAKSDEEMKRRQAALDQVAFFAPLAAEERALVAAGMHLRVYAAGEIIIHTGDPGQSLYLLCAGEARVKISLAGLEKEVATLHEGQFFGEMSLLTGAPRRATVYARTDTECYELDRSLFQQILQENPSLVGPIGKLL